MLAASLALLCTLCSAAALAAEGELDTAFGVGGFARNGLPGGNGDASPLVVQPDGKSLIGGTTIASGNSDFEVARFTAQGMPDVTFAGTGKRSIDFAANADYATSLALQPDGKILVAGMSFRNDGTAWNFAVARLDAQGELDATFGDGTGKVTVSISAGSMETANGVAVQADGKIVLAGYTSVAGHSEDFAVIRLLADGSLDPSFNGSGIVTVSFDLPGSGARDHANAVAIDDAQRIVLAGVADAGSFHYRFAAARLLADGSLDASFGSGGRTTIAFGSDSSGGDAQALALAVLHDGRIALAGYSDVSATSTPNHDLAVAALLADGSPDLSFGVDGRFRIAEDLAAKGDDQLRAIGELADGRLLAVGYASHGASADALSLRLDPSGNLDGAYGTGGIQRYDFDDSVPEYGAQRLLGVATHGPFVYASAWIISYAIPQENTVIRLKGDTIFIDGFDAS